MGNCMGQRKLGGGGSRKENAPKTPMKNEGEKVKTQTSEGKGKIAENGSRKKEAVKVDVSEEKQKVDSVNHNKEANNEKIADDKLPTGKEILSTSWVVFDEPDEKKSNLDAIENQGNSVKDSTEKENKAKKEENVAVENKNGKENTENRSFQSNFGVESQTVVSNTSKGQDSKSQQQKEVKVKDETKVEVKVKDQPKKDVKVKDEPKKEVKVKDEPKKEVKVKDEPKKEVKVKDEPKMEVKVKDVPKKEVKVKDDRPTYADKVKATTKDTGKPDARKSDENTGEPESINILHEVKDGRVVIKQQTDAAKKNKNENKEESEKEKTHKRLDVLKVKMEKYTNMKKLENNVIDFEKMFFVDKVLGQKVLLEDVVISGREICGLVAVSSIEERPKVMIRFTTDCWKSKLDEEAIPFIGDNKGEELFQRFFFAIFVPFAKSVIFAVECIGAQGTIWDNQSGKNYEVENAKEKEGPGKLVANFTLPRQALFAEHVQRKSVCLKSASLQNGTATLVIAATESCDSQPKVRYTLDDWKTFKDITSAKIEAKGKMQLRLYKAVAILPKGAKMVFAIFWKQGDREFWDNSDGKNYEIRN